MSILVQSKLQNIAFFEALGVLTALCMSSAYRSWTIEDIHIYLRPALQAEQCKIYFDEVGTPAAFITWALVDDECHEALLTKGQNPPDDQWNSGEHLWFMDLVAPFGHTLSVIRDMQRNYFPHVHAHSIRRSPDGSVRRVNNWRNA